MAVIHTYPKTLRPTILARSASVLIALAFTALAAYSAWPGVFDESDGIRFLWIGIALAAAMWAGAVPSFYMYLRMEQNRLTFRGYLRKIVINKADILETSNVDVSGNTITLSVKVRGLRWPVEISNFGQIDEAFGDWFDGIPNAEQREELRHFERILANPAFGNNPTEREAQYEIDARRLNLLRWPLWAASLWGFFWPLPEKPCLAILMAIPPLTVAMVMLSGDRWSVSDQKSGRISIGHLAILPCLCLGLWALRFNNLDDIVATLAWGAGAGLMLTLIVAVAERYASWRSTIWVYILCFAYAWGGMVHINEAYDTAPPHIYKVEVVRKSTSNQRKYFKVGPWGNHARGRRVKAPRSLYESVTVGEAVCVVAHAGAMNWTWYKVKACPATPPK